MEANRRYDLSYDPNYDLCTAGSGPLSQTQPLTVRIHHWHSANDVPLAIA